MCGREKLARQARSIGHEMRMNLLDELDNPPSSCELLHRSAELQFPMCLTASERAERQRRSSFQPRVACASRLPWVGDRIVSPTLKGLQPCGVGQLSLLQPFQGCGVFNCPPRVAPAAQPWAEGWNAVGVLLSNSLNANPAPRASGWRRAGALRSCPRERCASWLRAK